MTKMHNDEKTRSARAEDATVLTVATPRILCAGTVSTLAKTLDALNKFGAETRGSERN